MGPEEPHPGGGELERERQPLQAPADGRDRRGVGLARLEGGGGLPGALYKELDGRGACDVLEPRRPGRVRDGEGCHEVLPFAPDAEGGAARGEHGEAGACLHEGRHLGRRPKQALEVVQYE